MATQQEMGDRDMRTSALQHGKVPRAQQCALPAPRRLVNFPFVQRAARGQNSLRLRPPQHRAQTRQAREPFFGTVAA
jgi:hypothetical protein